MIPLDVTVLSKADVDSYLRRIGEVSATNRIVDMHVHATEVIRGQHREVVPETRRRRNARRLVAETSRLVLRAGLGDGDQLPEFEKNLSSALLFELAYRNLGPDDLRAHMQLAKVDAALLLPVARAGQSIDDQMRILQRFKNADDRLRLAYCVPDAVANSEIRAVLSEARVDYDVRAVKFHPNLSEIDVGSAAGRARTEAIVAACDALRLPLIVHGGRSPILGKAASVQNAVLSKLAAIEWSASNAPVVIAHFGAYGCRADEIPEHARCLNTLLEQHENLRADTSGISFSRLTYFLRVVDHDRILFGSDAMYIPMWRSIVQLLRALEKVAPDPEDAFVSITSTNSRKCFNLDVAN